MPFVLLVSFLIGQRGFWLGIAQYWDSQDGEVASGVCIAPVRHDGASRRTLSTTKALMPCLAAAWRSSWKSGLRNQRSEK